MLHTSLGIDPELDEYENTAPTAATTPSPTIMISPEPPSPILAGNTDYAKT